MLTFRIIVSVICIVILVGWNVFCINNLRSRKGNATIEAQIELIYDVGYYTGTGFLVLTPMLFLSIALVIWRLKVKQRQEGISKLFKKEIWRLIIILLIFSSSFLLRYIYDEWLDKLLTSGSGDDLDKLCFWEDGTYSICSPYLSCFWLLVTQYFFDLIPIGIIFLFHHFSFRDNDDQ